MRKNSKKQPTQQDLTGRIFGNLTVLRYNPTFQKKKHYGTGGVTWQGRWICACKCGKEVATLSNPLLNGKTQSCGCLKKRDLTGEKFGRLTVVSLAPSKNMKSFWNCVCGCGKKKVVGAYKLLSGNTKSCGCKKKEAPPEDILQRRILRQKSVSKETRAKLYEHIVETCSTQGFKLLTSKETFIGLENPHRDHLTFKCQKDHTFDIDWFSFNPRPFCRKCLQWKSQGELSLRTWLMSILGEEKIVPNFRNPVPDVYEVDIYLPDYKLGIEYNGLYWHTRGDKDRHLIKRESLLRGGIGCFQFLSDEWDFKRPIVESIIKNKLGLSDTQHQARKLNLVVVSPTEAAQFFSDNHLMGPYKAAVALGLKTEGGFLVSCLSYRICSGQIEIARFACAMNTSVAGGFSRLLKEVERKHPTLSIISWVDLRYGTGQSLLKLGFVQKKITLGWRWTDGKSTYNRLRCRANMDSRKLKESEYAKELGWTRIYDAGQALFVKEK